MIVITGASDGLGKQLAKLYKDTGKKVVNVSRTDSEHADVNIACDLAEAEQIEQAARDIEAIDEKLEALILCAGTLSIEPLGSISEKELSQVFDVNIRSQILLVSELTSKITNDRTDIVNIASTVGTKGYSKQAAYGSSKWAVRGFSRNLQEEFKNLPNRVISFCPGGFESKLFEKATGKTDVDFTHWMKSEDLALFMKQILDLPKNMEVSEVVINRKTTR